MSRKRILIAGGGYGGLAAMRALCRRLNPSEYSIALINERDQHTVTTRLHEVAVSTSRDVLTRFPIEPMSKMTGAEFIMARVEKVDLDARVVMARGRAREYDILLLALGAEATYHGVPGAKEHSVPLLNWDSARKCARHIERMGMRSIFGPRRRVVIVGAGLIGVEVAAMLRQYVPPHRCEILMLERAERIMPNTQCGDAQRDYVRRYLRHHDIRVRCGASLALIDEGGVKLESGNAWECDLVIWAAGVRRATVPGIDGDSPFLVNRFLQSPLHPEVFAVGDFATIDDSARNANLFSAQRALYHAGVAAENIARRERYEIIMPARYRPLGELIALGDADGAGIVSGIPITGAAMAAMKKANEAKYLASLLEDVPEYFRKSLSK